MAKPCMICAEPGIRDSVDRQLAEGVTIRDVAEVVQRSRSTIGRHKLHGNDERDERGIKRPEPRAPKKPARGKKFAIGRAPRTLAKPSYAGRTTKRNTGQTGRLELDHKSFATPEDVIDHLCWWLDRVKAVGDEAQRLGRHELMLKASKEAKTLQDAIARLKGFTSDNATTVNVDLRRQSVAVFDKLDEETLRRLAYGTPADAVSVGAEAVHALPAAEDAIDVESRALEA